MDITAVAKVPIKMTLNAGLPFPRGKCISLTHKKRTLLHMFVFSHPPRNLFAAYSFTESVLLLTLTSSVVLNQIDTCLGSNQSWMEDVGK